MTLLKDTFKAWLANEAGRGTVLNVKGDVQDMIETKLTLVRAEPQGFNPAVLMLKVNAEEPTSGVARSRAIGSHPVSYQESVTPHQYKSVTIQAENESVTINVDA